ncbi:hypothetical protein [Streptomyces sp. NPDC046161]|uniref:hypothetical protein n=1 Tax=Streptomyces sp. NPDC046161 TaxID=3155132 RepID=UPI0033F68E93
MADTLPIDTTSMAQAELPPAPTPSIARLDVPLAQLDADLQSLRLKRETAECLRAGRLAEYSHLLHDADPDASTRPFPDLSKGIPARLLDGGQS